MAKPAQTLSEPRSVPETFRRMAVYTPVLIAILLMLPRLLAPQFGLFDDGRILVTAEKISHGTWYTGADSLEGRFRPVHWLWFTLSYLIGGKNPFWFYVANTLALAVVVAGLIFLAQAVGGSRLQAWFAGLVFVLAGPVPESFLTLKGEVIQVTLMLLSLLTMLPYGRARRLAQKIGGIAITTFILLLAYLTKETAIVILPVSLAWYLPARFWPGYERNPARLAARGAYLLANLIAAPVFFLMRTVVLSANISGGTYSGQYAVQLGQLAVSALRWAGWLVRDFTWVVPLFAFALIFMILRRRLAGRSMLLEAFFWMGAWACIYLPWTFMAEYYMLPFALGLAVFVSACAVEIAPAFRDHDWKRWTAMAVVGLSTVLLAGSLLNTLTNARVQLAVDSANAAMMATLVHNTEPNSTILVNIQNPNEYFVEMQTQLGQVYNRPDLKVSTFRSDLSLPGNGTPIYIVSPFVKNQPLLSVRMGVIEATQNMWNESLQGFLQAHPGWYIATSPSGSFRLSDVNYPRLFCPFVKTRAFCATPAPLVDTRDFSYGWTVYKLQIR